MSVNYIPEGYHSVTPLISVKGASRLIDFMKKAFGATEIYSFPSPDGTIMHAEMKIGDSIIMVGEAMKGASTMPCSLYLYVQHVDSTYRNSVDAGGETIDGPNDMFWGDRVASIKDFAGNKWMMATHVEDVSAEELERRAQQAMAA